MPHILLLLFIIVTLEKRKSLSFLASVLFVMEVKYVCSWKLLPTKWCFTVPGRKKPRKKKPKVGSEAAPQQEGEEKPKKKRKRKDRAALRAKKIKQDFAAAARRSTFERKNIR